MSTRYESWPYSVTTENYRKYENGDIEVYQIVTGLHYNHLRNQSAVIKSDHVTPTNYSAKYFDSIPVYFDRTGTLVQRRRNPNTGTYMNYVAGQRGTRKYSQNSFGSLESDPTSDVCLTQLSVARSRALEKMVDSTVNVGNFLGELPETAKMLAGAASKLLKLYRAVKGGNLRKASKILGLNVHRNTGATLADVWFQYKYGWEPLVKDIYHMHSAISAQLNRPHAQCVKGVSVTEFQYTQVAEPAYIIPIKMTKGAEVKVCFRVNNSTLAGLNSLGLINPFSIMWELLPMSFVIDWIFPIGSFLQQLSAPLGLSFAHGYETTFAYGNMVLVDEAVGFTGTHPSYHITGFGMNRRKLVTWPKSSLVVDLGLNLNQVATIVGLIAQRA